MIKQLTDNEREDALHGVVDERFVTFARLIIESRPPF